MSNGTATLEVNLPPSEVLDFAASPETGAEQDLFGSLELSIAEFAGSAVTENTAAVEVLAPASEMVADTPEPNLTPEDKVFGRLDAPLARRPIDRPPRRWLRAAAAVLSSYMTLSALSASPAAAAQTTHASQPSAEAQFILDGNQQVTRNNYAGIALHTNGNMGKVVESFTVPNAVCTPGAEALVFVGMSGSIAPGQPTNIEQLELYGQCSGGRHPQVTFSGDVEMYPDKPQAIFLTAKPGQEVEMDITHEGRGPGSFDFDATNISNGTGQEITLPCPSGDSCARDYAEGVVERLKNASGQFIAFPRLGATAFRNMEVRLNNGSYRGLSGYENQGQVVQINMVSGDTTILETSGPDPMNEGYLVTRP